MSMLPLTIYCHGKAVHDRDGSGSLAVKMYHEVV